MIKGLSTLGEKGQVTIPKELRELLVLSPGDKVLFELIDGEMILKKAGARSLAELLDSHGPWEKNGVEFQRELRKEWDNRSQRL